MKNNTMIPYNPKKDLETNYYNKTEVELLVAGGSGGSIDLSNYYKKLETYSKAEVDDLISSGGADLSDYYTKAEVDNLISAITETDLTNYYNKTEVDSLIPDISTKQDNLVSGTSIKTINGKSVLGSGDIIITGGGSGDGKSAYELWLDEGNSGTLSDFMESIKGQNGLPGRAGRDGTVEFDLLTELQKESLKGESQLKTMESGNLIKESIDGDTLIINKPLAYNSFDNDTFNIYGTGDNKIKIKPTNLVDRAPMDTDEFQITEVDIRNNPLKDGSVVSRYALENDLAPSVGNGSINTLNNNTYSFKEVDGVKYLDTIIKTTSAYMKSPVINVGTNFTINFKFKSSSTTNAAILHFKNVEVVIWNGKLGYILTGGLKSTPITPQVGRWYDITVTVAGATGKIYIDGKLQTTGDGGGYGIVVTNYIGMFGRSYDKSSPYVGGIRGIRILNRAITDEEAMALFNDVPDELIALYHGLGEVATKATANHHTINLKAPTFKSADDARKYGLKIGDIYIEVDTLKVLLPV